MNYTSFGLINNVPWQNIYPSWPASRKTLDSLGQHWATDVTKLGCTGNGHNFTIKSGCLFAEITSESFVRRSRRVLWGRSWLNLDMYCSQSIKREGHTGAKVTQIIKSPVKDRLTVHVTRHIVVKREYIKKRSWMNCTWKQKLGRFVAVGETCNTVLINNNNNR